MQYDIVYLGTSIDLPGWSLLVLGAPAPTHIGGILLSDDVIKSMNFDANWGLVLKVGDRAFEADPNGCPYKPGDWVIFEDFHPEARYIHGVLVYFIPDARVIGKLPEIETFEPYLNFREVLPEMEERASELRKSLLLRTSNLIKE